jgi:hypothetical protein
VHQLLGDADVTLGSVTSARLSFLFARGILSVEVNQVSDPFADFRRSTWQLHPRLDLAVTPKPALQYAILESNPLPGFRQRLVGPTIADVLASLPDVAESDRRPMMTGLLTGVWDRVFHDVPGDQVYLLDDHRVVHSEEPAGENGVNVHMSATFSAVSSNGPAGQKWVVTKAVQHKDTVLAWAVLTTTTQGQMVTVTLNIDNAIDLHREWAERSGRQ